MVSQEAIPLANYYSLNWLSLQLILTVRSTFIWELTFSFLLLFPFLLGPQPKNCLLCLLYLLFDFIDS